MNARLHVEVDVRNLLQDRNHLSGARDVFQQVHVAIETRPEKAAVGARGTYFASGGTVTLTSITGKLSSRAGLSNKQRRGSETTSAIHADDHAACAQSRHPT
jgi:hypothetical protein